MFYINSQVILTDSTPIVVLEYENLNLSADNLTAQAICVSTEKESPSSATVALAVPPSKLADVDETTGANPIGVSSQNSSEKQVPTTVNIIRCITSTGVSCDDVPTIHIVDTLENEAVVKKIEGAFHNLNPADIRSIEELVNKNGTTTPINKEEKISLSFLNAATILQAKESVEKRIEEPSNGNGTFNKTFYHLLL
jgi:hypothetical protein